MERDDSVENKNVTAERETNGKYDKAFLSYRNSLEAWLKKIVSFICYGPGVLGFLWLIGRILKR